MAVVPRPIFPQVIKSDSVQILPADTTTLKTLYTADADGSLIMGILVSSTDTANKDIAFYITVSGTDHLLGTLQIPLNAGNTNAVPLVSVFSHSQFANMLKDVNGNSCLYLGSGAVLKVKALTTVTAAKIIDVMIQGGDF